MKTVLSALVALSVLAAAAAPVSAAEFELQEVLARAEPLLSPDQPKQSFSL